MNTQPGQQIELATSLASIGVDEETKDMALTLYEDSDIGAELERFRLPVGMLVQISEIGVEHGEERAKLSVHFLRKLQESGEISDRDAYVDPSVLESIGEVALQLLNTVDPEGDAEAGTMISGADWEYVDDLIEAVGFPVDQLTYENLLNLPEVVGEYLRVLSIVQTSEEKADQQLDIDLKPATQESEEETETKETTEPALEMSHELTLRQIKEMLFAAALLNRSSCALEDSIDRTSPESTAATADRLYSESLEISRQSFDILDSNTAEERHIDLVQLARIVDSDTAGFDLTDPKSAEETMHRLDSMIRAALTDEPQTDFDGIEEYEIGVVDRIGILTDELELYTVSDKTLIQQVVDAIKIAEKVSSNEEADRIQPEPVATKIVETNDEGEEFVL